MQEEREITATPTLLLPTSSPIARQVPLCCESIAVPAHQHCHANPLIPCPKSHQQRSRCTHCEERCADPTAATCPAGQPCPAPTLILTSNAAGAPTAKNAAPMCKHRLTSPFLTSTSNTAMAHTANNGALMWSLALPGHPCLTPPHPKSHH